MTDVLVVLAALAGILAVVWWFVLRDADDEDSDELDGLCDPELQPEVIPDEDIDGVVLFADVAGMGLDAIEKRRKEYQELWGDASTD